FARFLARFPDVETLAAAPLDEVLALWAGLGYYARARNLHRAAQVIVEQHAGYFPATPEALSTLPGIGRSTAAAIAVFAFGAKAAILDGNVKRVLCRHFCIEESPSVARENRLWTLAESLLPDDPDDLPAYTQGLMDLGATRCVRSKPHCAACPLSATCLGHRRGIAGQLPAKTPKKAKPKREATFWLITDGQHILLTRRPPSGIWGGLHTFPAGEEPPVPLAAPPEIWPDVKHVFTHFELTIHPRLCRLPALPPIEGLTPISLPEALTLGLPAPVARLLRALTGHLSGIA
ncbi:MAG: NUDIX domain-containing protein, partial [Zoogloeaceae bacterium]|nr:NUDIX domain-containing protein [Zoogloeaceae bacterium]